MPNLCPSLLRVVRTLTACLAVLCAPACTPPQAPAPAGAEGARAVDPEAAAPVAVPAPDGEPAPTVEEGSAAGEAPEPEPEVPAGPEPHVGPDGMLRPLTEAERALLTEFAEDEEPEVLNAVMEENQGTHFLYSDELHLYNFEPRLRGLGGAYIGVGTDQAWLFAGWQRAELAFLADYDPWVVALQRAYVAFLEVSEDAATFRSWWSQGRQSEGVALLSERWADRSDLPLILHVYRHARSRVSGRLARIPAMTRDHGTPTFLTDPDQYRWVRSLVQTGRVRPMVGNLLADRGWRNAGAAAQALGIPIRNAYLSNAEDYWGYSDVFRDNMRALYADERSLVSRTRATKPRNGDYRYQQQPLQNFVRWLDSGTRSCRTMWGYAPVGENEFPITFFEREPSP
jgi:hypothetical protein